MCTGRVHLTVQQLVAMSGIAPVGAFAGIVGYAKPRMSHNAPLQTNPAGQTVQPTTPDQRWCWRRSPWLQLEQP